MAVLFYTEWCGYCRRMDRDILSSPEVNAYLGEIVAVKINPDKGSDEKLLARSYGIRGFPSFFIVSPRGGRFTVHPFRSDGRRVVSMTPAEFVAACRGGGSG